MLAILKFSKERQVLKVYHVLFVDDDENVLKINETYFKSHGYQVTVANSGKLALEAVKKTEFDCIILDIILPNEDGYVICKEIRNLTHTPIIFVSSLAEKDFIYKGFNVGGEDYMTKPYDLKELFVRTEAHIARYRGTSKRENILTVPPIKMNLTNRKVSINDVEISLTSVEFKILLLLCQHPGKPFTPNEIYNEVWEMPDINAIHTVHSHIGRMRKKLDSIYKDHQLIQTQWGKGYILIPEDK